MAKKTEELPDSAEDLRHLDAVLQCPVCKERRRRSSSGWLCVKPGHTGIMGKFVFAVKLGERLRMLKGEDETARAKRIASLVKQAEQEDRKLSTTTTR